MEHVSFMQTRQTMLQNFCCCARHLCKKQDGSWIDREQTHRAGETIGQLIAQPLLHFDRETVQHFHQTIKVNLK